MSLPVRLPASLPFMCTTYTYMHCVCMLKSLHKCYILDLCVLPESSVSSLQRMYFWVSWILLRVAIFFLLVVVMSLVFSSLFLLTSVQYFWIEVIALRFAAWHKRDQEFHLPQIKLLQWTTQSWTRTSLNTTGYAYITGDADTAEKRNGTIGQSI